MYSVTHDLQRERLTGCLGGRIMCLSVATDLHTGKRVKTVSRRQYNMPECSD